MWICPNIFQNKIPKNLYHKQNLIKQKYKNRRTYQNVHTLVRKIFFYKKSMGRIFIKITADDYYKMYINGLYIAQGPAQSYHFSYNYNYFEITGFLDFGKNILAFDVYYEGLINRATNSGDYRQGLYAIIYDGNQNKILETDENWKYKISKSYIAKKTCGYFTQFLEYYNSKKEQKNWKELSYDDKKWKFSCKKECDYTFRNFPVPVLQVYQKSPITIKELYKNIVFYDFGSEITACLEIKAIGEKNSSITILFGEEILKNSKYLTRFDMRCNCNYKDMWHLSKGENKLEQYNYKAFRYVTIIQKNSKIVDIKANVQHYPFDEKAFSLKTNNKIFDNIIALCKNTIKYGCQEAFLDCPTREKGQYLGDMFISSQSRFYFTGDTSLMKKAILDFADSSKICNGIMAVAPGNFMQEIADFSLLFPKILLNYYTYTGDKKFLQENIPICENLLMYFKKFENKDGILENVDKWNLVDWPEKYRDNYNFANNKAPSIINAYYIGSIETINKIKDILSLQTKVPIERRKKMFKEYFYNKDTNLYCDTNKKLHSSFHVNVLAIYFDISQNEISVLNFIKEKGMICSVYFSYFYLKALCKAKQYKDVFNLIISKQKNSWYNMLAEGATTCFEAWGKEEKWNTSLCHPWATAPIIILMQDLLNIKIENGKIICSEKHTNLPKDFEIKNIKINF